MEDGVSGLSFVINFLAHEIVDLGKSLHFHGLSLSLSFSPSIVLSRTLISTVREAERDGLVIAVCMWTMIID